MKPNYMIIGAAKCGSTSLAKSLASHPDIFLTKPKEIHFFSKDEQYIKGGMWYESLYDKAGDAKMRGEASMSYTMKEVHPKCLPRLVDYTTDLKVIYIVRNPIERIPSWWANCRMGVSPRDVHYSFSKALRINRALLIDSSNYLEQLDAYRKYFSDNQILVVFFEDFIKSPQLLVHRCFEFLGVDPEFTPPKEVTHLNPTDNQGTISTPLHSILRKFRSYQMLSKILPEEIRLSIREWSPVKQLLVQPRQKPKWDEESLKYVVDILGEPSRQFLTRYGKSPDFWNLDLPTLHNK